MNILSFFLDLDQVTLNFQKTETKASSVSVHENIKGICFWCPLMSKGLIHHLNWGSSWKVIPDQPRW